ncbi:hypothetical protein ACFU3O_35520 [Streptomyces antibioticus]|uniref:hypothetical protein n=1 Tax=Streptomyces antibioticus TaxID=1890 RepID=UPI00367F0FD5
MQAHLTIDAAVGPTVALMQADGSPLPDKVELDCAPGQGFMPWSQQVRICSHETDMAVEV